jgi:hypothetical protein
MTPIELLRMKWDATNPAAPLDRRHRLAKAYAQREIPCSRHDDDSTRTLWQFYRDSRKTRGSVRRIAVVKAHRALIAAIDIHHGEAEDLRPFLEAFLLTELDDAAIGRELQLSEETVRWYRLCFFDLEPIRNSPQRVLHKVIGIYDEDGRLALTPHKLWKWVAYVLKSTALKKLLALSSSTTAGTTDWTEWVMSQILASVKFKQLLAVSVMKSDDPKQNGVLLKLLTQELGLHDREKDEKLHPLEQGLQEMINSIAWTVGDDAKKSLRDSPLLEYDENAAELRDDEVMRAAAGEEIKNREEIRSLKIGPPTRQRSTLEMLHPKGETHPGAADAPPLSKPVPPAGPGKTLPPGKSAS